MFKEKIKYLIEICFNFNMFFKKDSEQKKVFLFLTPQYLNYGDHAIAEAEKKYLKSKFSCYKIEEINYSFWEYWPKKVRKLVKKNDILLITGGGYAGDLWPENQKLLEEVIISFPNNKIILAPQTIFYKNQGSDKSYRLFQKTIEKARKIHIIAREKNTYDLLVEKFQMMPGENLFSLADFVLTLHLENTDKKRKGIALCLRNDCEKVMSHSELEKAINFLNINKKDIYNIKMSREHVEIPTWTRYFFLKHKFAEFQKRRLVITDRLHGMIFAAITETPCIALDNISHKISGTYKNIRSLSYVKVAESPEQIIELSKKILDIPEEKRKEDLKALQERIDKEYEKIFCRLII